VTGVAGPSGGSDDKPVGTVFIGAASRAGHADVRRFRFPGARDVVRDRAAKMALAMLRFGVNRLGVPRLLWQVA
ncbi:MAG: CinA family protein, partial [Planctomycetes bacterium]|nr:CinA family protein [Planctomycetota bacterium]